MVVGEGGIGFVWIRPVACNDLWSCAFTNATSTGGLNTALSAMGGSSLAYLANCPYTAAMFGNDEILARNTSFGVRIKYTGELMGRNGVVYTFEHPDRDSLDAWTIQEIIDSNFCKQQAVLGKKWDAAVCGSGPVAPINLEYTKDPNQGSTNVWIGIIVTGKPGDTYMVDYANRTEYIGSSASQKTPTRPAGSQFGSAVAAVKDTVLSTGPLKPTDTKSVWDKFTSYVAESVPYLVEGAKAVGGAISSVVTGNPVGALTAANSMMNMFTMTQNTPKLLTHQVQAIKHTPSKQVHRLGAAHSYTPYDPLIRHMFTWYFIATSSITHYSHIPIPKAELFIKPFDLPTVDVPEDQLPLCVCLNSCFICLTQLVLLDPDSTPYSSITTYLLYVQELIDTFFGDDVPPVGIKDKPEQDVKNEGKNNKQPLDPEEKRKIKLAHLWAAIKSIELTDFENFWEMAESLIFTFQERKIHHYNVQVNFSQYTVDLLNKNTKIVNKKNFQYFDCDSDLPKDTYSYDFKSENGTTIFKMSFPLPSILDRVRCLEQESLEERKVH